MKFINKNLLALGFIGLSVLSCSASSNDGQCVRDNAEWRWAEKNRREDQLHEIARYFNQQSYLRYKIRAYEDLALIADYLANPYIDYETKERLQEIFDDLRESFAMNEPLRST
jgi:hypothetical protein